jgi:hypothetical protein
MKLTRYELEYFSAAERCTAMLQPCPSVAADTTSGRGWSGAEYLTPNSSGAQSVADASPRAPRGLVDVLGSPRTVGERLPSRPPSAGPMAPNTPIASTPTSAVEDSDPVLFDLPASEWLEHDFQQAANKAAAMMLATPRQTPVAQPFETSACLPDTSIFNFPPLSAKFGDSPEASYTFDADVGGVTPCFANMPEVGLTSAIGNHAKAPSPSVTPNLFATTPEVREASPGIPHPLTVPSPMRKVPASTSYTRGGQTKRKRPFVDARTEQAVAEQNEYSVPRSTRKSRRLVDARTGLAPTEETQERVPHADWVYRRPVNALGVHVAYGTPGSRPRNEYMNDLFSPEETAEYNRKHGVSRPPEQLLSRGVLLYRTRPIDVETGKTANGSSKHVVPYYAWEGRRVVPQTGELAARGRKPTVTYAEYVKSEIARTKIAGAMPPT